MNDLQQDKRQSSPPVALVTGSSKGIGAAIATAFAKEGSRVVLHGRTESVHLVDTTNKLLSDGAEAKFVTCDFSQPASSLEDHLRQFAESAHEQFGTLDILVNNAGGDVLTGEAQDWDFETKLGYLLQVDVSATLLLSRIVGERMVKDSSALESPSRMSIVNIGWDQAWQGMAGDSGEMFATTKGAIMAMTKSLAQSLAPNVRVNCVAPGWIQTDWGHNATTAWHDRAVSESLMQRWGTAEDIAKAVAFLASDQASFISGQVIPVNGGFKYFQVDREETSDDQTDS